MTAGEARLRGIAALMILLSQIVGAVGLAWDIQWHVSVGRDTFLTPPHVLLYTSIAVTGLVCLAMVLVDTWRARTGGPVHDGNAVRVLGLFQAPLGFILAGCGALLTASAAPLDDYWHQLYGIDVALWAPFHTMGSLGGFVGVLGSLYAWASLLVHERRSGWTRLGRPAWGLLTALMLLVGTASIQTRPALFTWPTLPVGPAEVALYPVLLGLFLPWLFVLARSVLGRRSGPLLLLALWAAFTAGLTVLVPWLVTRGAAAEGLPLRIQGIAPSLALLSVLQALGLAVLGLVVTALLWRWPVQAGPGWQTVARTGAWTGLAVWLVGSALALYATSQMGLAAGLGLPIAEAGETPASLAAALPLAVVTSWLSVALGAALGQILRRSPR